MGYNPAKQNWSEIQIVSTALQKCNYMLPAGIHILPNLKIKVGTDSDLFSSSISISISPVNLD